MDSDAPQIVLRSNFERLTENIMAGLLWEVLLVYMDDIIVFGKTVEEEKRSSDYGWSFSD